MKQIYQTIKKIKNGPGKDERIGNRIFLRYIRINLELRKTSTSTINNPYIRIIILLPRKDTEQYTLGNTAA